MKKDSNKESKSNKNDITNKIKNLFKKMTKSREKNSNLKLTRKKTSEPREKVSIETSLFKLCYYVGASVILIINRIKRRIEGIAVKIQRLYRRFAKKLGRKTEYYRHVFSTKNAIRKERLRDEVATVKRRVERKKKRADNVKFIDKFKIYFGEIRSSKELSKRIVDLGLPIACFIVFMLVLFIANSFTVALRVTVRGNDVGFIQNESIFEAADKSLQKRMIYGDGDSLVRNIPVYTIALVSPEEMNTSDQVCDNIISASGKSFTKATGIYADGRLIGATTEGDKLKTFLKETLDAGATDDPKDKVSFQKNIETTDGLFMVNAIKPYDEIFNTISGNQIEEKVHAIEKGDTPISIAKKYGMSVAQLFDMNPSYDRNRPVLKVGQSMTVQQEQRYLAVQVTKTISYSEEIDFAVNEVKSFSYFVGTKKVAKYGEKGSADVVAEVVYIDGKEVSKTVVSRTVTKEPVDQVVNVGSKVQTSIGNIDMGSINSTGSYVWPVQGGSYNYVSMEMYGYWGHTGMDIAAPSGTSIVAVDSGIVTVSSRLYMNGLYVVVNHSNGIQTMYCHCSELLVSAGQSVSKGQLIARVGHTGNATGNHLHIEFRKNGVLQNPRAYLGR